MKIVMKLKEIFKCLLLIFLYCNDNRNPKFNNIKTSKHISDQQQKHQENSKRLEKLKCICKQLSSVTLCPKQQTRPANHTEFRQKLQGRKPKFKVGNRNKFNTRKSEHKCSTLMIMRTMTRIGHLTAKEEQVAAAEAANIDDGSNSDCGSGSDSGSNVDRQLSKAAAKRGVSRPAIDIWLNI